MIGIIANKEEIEKESLEEASEAGMENEAPPTQSKKRKVQGEKTASKSINSFTMFDLYDIICK